MSLLRNVYVGVRMPGASSIGSVRRIMETKEIRSNEAKKVPGGERSRSSKQLFHGLKSQANGTPRRIWRTSIAER
jgi:hypothetical protein